MARAYVHTCTHTRTHAHTPLTIQYICACVPILAGLWILGLYEIRVGKPTLAGIARDYIILSVPAALCGAISWVLFQWRVSSKMKDFQGKNHEFWDARKHNLWIRRGLGNIPNHYSTDYWPFLALSIFCSTINRYKIPNMILWLRDWIIQPCFKLRGMFIEAWHPCMFNRKILLAWRHRLRLSRPWFNHPARLLGDPP